MDITATVTALWIAVYATAAISAMVALRRKEKKNEPQPIRIEENSESR